MPVSLRPELPDALRRLRDDLAALRLQLELPDSRRARAARDDIVGQTDDYLLPRLDQMDAPVLMVVGGSTGAGKSTILNSLVGAEVSPSGVLRPTTRGPVLVCHPDDVPWFEGDRILPGLPRVARCGAGNVKARVAGGGTARRSVGTTADRHVIGRLMAPVKTGAIPAAARNRHHATGLCERVT